MPIVRLILLAFLFGSVASLQAQSTDEPAVNPETVLISRFNFVRPKNWQWQDTRSNPQIQQSVTFLVENNEECAVFIHHFAPNKPAGSRKVSAARWKETFADADPTADFGKPVTVGTNKVYYLELTGTHQPEKPRNKKDALRRNITQFGAVVEDPDGNLVFRLIGPTALVQRAKPDFKRMIEDALKEE